MTSRLLKSARTQRGRYGWAIVLVLGMLGTIQYHRAQFGSRFDTFFGDRGDVRGVVFFCEHWYHALIGKASLMSPAIFYPTKGTLAYSDLLVGFAIPYSLLRALGLGMFTSLEVVVIGLTFLNYLACLFLLRKTLRFSLFASCAGAMFFAFSSPRFCQLIHLQLQFVLFLPLMLICVITIARQYERMTNRRGAILLSMAVVLLVLQTLTTFYYTWYLVFWSLPFLAFAFAFRPSRRFISALLKKRWLVFLPASVLFIFGAILFLVIYVPAMRTAAWYRYDFVSQMIPAWWSLLSMGDGNYVWGWLTARVTPNPPPSTLGELKVGIGLVVSVVWLVLTVWAIRLMKRLRIVGNKNEAEPFVSIQDAVPAFLVAMILATTVFYLIAFKYGDSSPWHLVFRFFPGAAAIRAVSRYVIFLSLPIAIGFAYALQSAVEWAKKFANVRYRKALILAIALVAGFAVFEQFGFPKTIGNGFSIRAENAYLNAMAAKLPRDCAAFYVAPGANGKHNPAEYQYDAMLISIISGVPSLNASMSQFPSGWGLYFVSDPAYESHVKQWIDSQRISGKVCRLEIQP